MSEDDLKALGAAAASSGAVALFHVVGVTPEAPDLETACGGLAPELRLQADGRRLARGGALALERRRRRAARRGLARHAAFLARGIRPPHAAPRRRAPAHRHLVNCSRATLDELRKRGWEEPLRAARVTLVADTCVYVSALMQLGAGAVMTNSGKCAYYAPGNLGVEVAYGSLAECVASARAGKVVRL